MSWRPKLRTVLILVNLAILALPIGSIAVLRIYETELVKATESDLLAQGTIISYVFRDRLLARMSEEPPRTRIMAAKVLQPLVPRLDVAREHLRPPAADAQSPESEPIPEAVAVGYSLIGLLRETQRATLAGIRIVDRNGTVISSTGSELGLSLAHREEVVRALKGELVSLLYMRNPSGSRPILGVLSRRTRYRVHVAIPTVYDGQVLGAVLLMRTPLDISKALYFHRLPLAVATLVLLGVVLVVSILTSLTISRPVNQLIKRIDFFSQAGKRPAAPLAKPGTREVERLSRAFEDMADKLEQRADYIKAFVSNVSHGFKTPLASMRASIELLQDHLDQMTVPERNRFLDILEKDTARLDHLVKDLIELARADVVQVSGETTAVSDVLQDLSQRYQTYGLKVSLDLDPAVDVVAVDRGTLESILANLLDNARQHGGDQVEVKIGTRARTDSAEKPVQIKVSDNGPGITASNAQRVFRPFFTTARDRGGSGLGLPIVQSLLKAHGGSIHLTDNSPGACFTILLPGNSPEKKVKALS